jgi:3-oxoadipate enol-lactonase
MLLRQPTAGYTATCIAIREADYTALLPSTAVPVLGIAGDSDVTTPPALVSATTAKIPGARFAVIEAAGHLPCIEQPARMARLIREFVESPARKGHLT